MICPQAFLARQTLSALIIVLPSPRGWARRGGQAKRSPTALAPGVPSVRAGPPTKKNVSRRDAKTQRRGAEQHPDAHRVLLFSLRLCVFARASLSSREDTEVDGTMIKTTAVSGETGRAPATQRRSGVAARDGFGGFGKMRTWTHLSRRDSIRQPAGSTGPAGNVIGAFRPPSPVPFDATAADIQKRANTPRHAVIWLVHVVVSPRTLRARRTRGSYPETIESLVERPMWPSSGVRRGRSRVLSD